MELYVNGEKINGGDRESLPLAELLHQYKVDPAGGGTAIAVNQDVVAKKEWATKELHDGDRVEIVTARQGG